MPPTISLATYLAEVNHLLNAWADEACSLTNAKDGPVSTPLGAADQIVLAVLVNVGEIEDEWPDAEANTHYERLWFLLQAHAKALYEHKTVHVRFLLPGILSVAEVVDNLGADVTGLTAPLRSSVATQNGLQSRLRRIDRHSGQVCRALRALCPRKGHPA